MGKNSKKAVKLDEIKEELKAGKKAHRKAAAEAKAEKAGANEVKAAPKCTVTVEFAGKSVDTADAVDRAIKAYMKSHKDAVIKTVALYIKPDESAAYYVVNGDASPSYRIAL